MKPIYLGRRISSSNLSSLNYIVAVRRDRHRIALGGDKPIPRVVDKRLAVVRNRVAFVVKSRRGPARDCAGLILRVERTRRRS